MKFMRIGKKGNEVPCALDDDGIAHDISSIVDDIGPETIDGLTNLLRGQDISALPAVKFEAGEISTPMSQPKNIYCIGLNYSDHAKEANLPIPSEPILFNKSAATFCGPYDPILYSPKMTKLDWEIELAIVIGKRTPFDLPKDQAPDYIFGYTVANDVSERAWQQERGGQWSKGKSFPNFCPTGPAIVTGDEIDDARNLKMWLDVNGKRMQDGNSNTMIFDCATIVSYLTEFMVLEPGDLIITGTPPGVGLGMNPQVFLKPGDVVTLGIENIGEQRQVVTPI